MNKYKRDTYARIDVFKYVVRCEGHNEIETGDHLMTYDRIPTFWANGQFIEYKIFPLQMKHGANDNKNKIQFGKV